MEIHQLRYFVAAAEAGSMTLAARRCHVAQPSLSQQVRRLEDSLGAELFDRLGRGVALTEAGHALLPRARQILARVHEVESGVHRDVEEGRVRLAVGAIPTMAPYLLPGLIAELRSEHPGCEVVVREDLTENLVERLVDNELDVAVMSSPVDHELVELEVVGREGLVVVAAADHPVVSSGSITIADLRDLPAVTLDEVHCLGKQVSDFCAPRRLAGNVVCRMTQIETLLGFVRLGLGVSIVPEMVSRHDTHEGRRYLPFRRQRPTREIALAWRRGRRRGRLAQRLGELLRTRLGGEDG